MKLIYYSVNGHDRYVVHMMISCYKNKMKLYLSCPFTITNFISIGHPVTAKLNYNLRFHVIIVCLTFFVLKKHIFGYKWHQVFNGGQWNNQWHSIQLIGNSTRLPIANQYICKNKISLLLWYKWENSCKRITTNEKTLNLPKSFTPSESQLLQ